MKNFMPILGVLTIFWTLSAHSHQLFSQSNEARAADLSPYFTHEASSGPHGKRFTVKFSGPNRSEQDIKKMISSVEYSVRLLNQNLRKLKASNLNMSNFPQLDRTKWQQTVEVLLQDVPKVIIKLPKTPDWNACEHVKTSKSESWVEAITDPGWGAGVELYFCKYTFDNDSQEQLASVFIHELAHASRFILNDFEGAHDECFPTWVQAVTFGFLGLKTELAYNCGPSVNGWVE